MEMAVVKTWKLKKAGYAIMKSNLLYAINMEMVY